MELDGLKPVEGQDDTFAFQYDFVPEGKAVDSDVITETEDGDLLIEGWAARFDGTDRQEENFAPGAFQRGIKNFLGGQAALCYNHDHNKVLGKVLELEEEEGKGLRLKARVDGAIQDHPELGTLYKQIKKGTINALSVGGFFKRGLTENGRRITNCDFTEISTTGVPVHPLTNFSVLAGKALESPAEEEEPTEYEVPAEVEAALDGVVELFDVLGARGEKALPKKHDQVAASRVAQLLRCLAKLRSEATYSQDDSDEENKAVAALASEIETQVSTWEASAHKLAAKVGPLPDLTPLY